MKNDFFDIDYDLMPREEFLQMEEELLEAERKDFIISLITKHHFDFRTLMVSFSMIILFVIVLSALSVSNFVKIILLSVAFLFPIYKVLCCLKNELHSIIRTGYTLAENKRIFDKYFRNYD
jgi:hypothetical protein